MPVAILSAEIKLSIRVEKTTRPKRTLKIKPRNQESNVRTKKELFHFLMGIIAFQVENVTSAF